MTDAVGTLVAVVRHNADVPALDHVVDYLAQYEDRHKHPSIG